MAIQEEFRKQKQKTGKTTFVQLAQHNLYAKNSDSHIYDWILQLSFNKLHIAAPQEMTKTNQQ